MEAIQEGLRRPELFFWCLAALTGACIYSQKPSSGNSDSPEQP
jgi:hypothetical protein